ncbi:hypothetical protein [Mycobacterium sp. 1274761.0]|uniref:hypothetical protein n=1 Tax=Mycobacterium sp. 1274761.0 TaxID=1834077 RepID=UPI0008024399|nr:hypothetical protein [Mycobacterium sp. 1274761.0]OBK77578.1 hypothetical protein A5651_04095 [Mycobacterium sp. 1274761.0]
MTSTDILPPFGRELTLGPFQQAASDAKEQFRIKAAAIRENPRLTGIGKQAALDELRERTRGVIKEAEAGHHASIEKRIAQLKRKLLDRGPNENNDAALTISYRDAAQRAAEIAAGEDAPKKSLELMGWALQNGDIPLQKALLRVAFDWRLEDVVDAFIAGRSEKKDAANELWDLTSGSSDAADLVFGIGYELQPDLNGTRVR